MPDSGSGGTTGSSGVLRGPVAVESCVGWDTTKEYLVLPSMGDKGTDNPERGRTAVTARCVSLALKKHAKGAGETHEFSPHSFRSGGAISRALAGEILSHSPSCITPRVYGKYVLDKSKDSVGIHATDGGGCTRLGGGRHGIRGDGGAARGAQWVFLEKAKSTLSGSGKNSDIV